MVSLLKKPGYTEIQGDGFRVKFDNGKPENLISLHKLDPGNEMKAYAG